MNQGRGKLTLSPWWEQSCVGNSLFLRTNKHARADATQPVSAFPITVGREPTIATDDQDIVDLRVKHVAITIGSALTIMASSGIEVLCPAAGFPKPTIKWYRNDMLLSSGMEMVIDSESGKLTLVSISHRKSGTFTCVASNVLGNASASSEIRIVSEYCGSHCKHTELLCL